MDIIFILKDSFASSWIDTMRLIKEAVNNHGEIGLLITQEAAISLNSGIYVWPAQLKEQNMRWKLADLGFQENLPIKGQGEGRQLDVKSYFLELINLPNVKIYVNEFWLKLSGSSTSEKFPSLQVISYDQFINILHECKKVIGTL